ncbi:MAG: MarC family protein [Rhodomicrobium sp.]|nr:MarC family protein [Rhodomicrobium sp.]
MLETALRAFATFFATIGPVEAAVLFASFCPGFSRAERIAVSLKAVAIATGIILFFAFFGTTILSALGVTFPALQAAGGIILAIIALDMIFEARIGGSTITLPESAEARAKNEDIAVFPLATPILAGPGAMSAAMLLMAGAKGNFASQAAVIAALLTVMAFTFLLLLAAQELREWIGVTAQRVVMRVFGVLLAAIAVQSLFNGIAGSGIFVRPV